MCWMFLTLHVSVIDTIWTHIKIASNRGFAFCPSGSFMRVLLCKMQMPFLRYKDLVRRGRMQHNCDKYGVRRFQSSSRRPFTSVSQLFSPIGSQRRQRWGDCVSFSECGTMRSSDCVRSRCTMARGGKVVETDLAQRKMANHPYRMRSSHWQVRPETYKQWKVVRLSYFNVRSTNTCQKWRKVFLAWSSHVEERALAASSPFKSADDLQRKEEQSLGY
jgi:hypothetical protein